MKPIYIYKTFLQVTYMCEHWNYLQQYIQIAVTQFREGICRTQWQTILFGSLQRNCRLLPGSGVTCKTICFLRQASALQIGKPAVWFPNRLEAADRTWRTMVRQHGDSRLDLLSSFHRVAGGICLHGYHSNMVLLLCNSPPILEPPDIVWINITYQQINWLVFMAFHKRAWCFTRYIFTHFNACL